MNLQEKFEKKMTEMLNKAQELVVEFAADIAVFVITSDGKEIYKFASSDMKKILAKCLDADVLPTFRFDLKEYEELVPEEIDVIKECAQMLSQKQPNMLDKDLTYMEFNELILLEERLTERMLCIKDRKAQILINQLLRSRMQEQLVLQENLILQRQVEELEGLLQSTKIQDNIGPAAKKEFLPSTSCADSLATNKDPEIDLNFEPEVQVSFPPTSAAAPSLLTMTKETGPSDSDSDSSLSFVCLLNTVLFLHSPYAGWL